MYPVVFIDAIHVKVRDGQVTNRPVYVAIGVTCGGERDILGLWAGDGGEGAKFWLAVLTEIKNRGTDDVCIVVCDGLKGLPEAITTVWDRAIVQTCVIHLLRNTFRYASRKYWDQIAKDIRPVYTAPTEAAAKERFVEFTAKWGAQYPAIIRLWENAWSEFVPFLDYDVEIRRVICSTNAVESLNARYRRAIRARGHFLLVTWNQIGAEKISARGDHGTGRRAWRQRGWRTSGRCSAGMSGRRAGCGCGPIWVGRRGRSTRMRAGLAEFLQVCEDHGIDPVTANRADVAVFVRELTGRPSRRGANVVSIDSGCGLANATIQQRLVPVRLFFDFLVEEGVRESNPVGRGRYTPGRKWGGAAAWPGAAVGETAVDPDRAAVARHPGGGWRPSRPEPGDAGPGL